MKIIDTHTHVYAEEFDNDRDEMIARAVDAGVDCMLLPNIDVESIERLHSLCKTHSQRCIPMMGLHPTSVGADMEKQLQEIRRQLEQGQYCGVGEIGLDFYWDRSFEKEQIQAFEEQLRWSIEYDLPVSIHSRDAIAQTIECIKNVGSDKLRGVFHSFGGTTDELNAILSLGNFLIGINGVVTFKNSTLGSVLKETDLSHIVIETDAPYLTPVPYRGKRNEPAYTLNIVEKLSDIYGVSREEVARITSENAKRMFGLNKFDIN